MSNLTIVREAVIRVVPEIMELKFGCEVEFIPRDGEMERGVIMREDLGNLHSPMEGYEVLVGGFQGRVGFIEREENYKIIGRPIQLADVLIAIGKSEKMAYTTLTLYGTKVTIVYRGSYCHWNLSQPLDGQEESTLEFLAELLGNKKEV